MFNKKRLKEVAKCPPINDLVAFYARQHYGNAENYRAGVMEVVDRIEDKLDFYCDRPNEFYGAIERMIKELKGE